MSQNDDIGFWDVVGAVAGAAALFGLAALSESAKEQNIDKLMALDMQNGLAVLAEEVPQMDNDTWQDFDRRLRSRAQYSEKAQLYLYFARCLVEAQNQVNQLIRLPIGEAHQLARGMLRAKNEAEKAAFYILLKANRTPQGQALLGYLLP